MSNEVMPTSLEVPPSAGDIELRRNPPSGDKELIPLRAGLRRGIITPTA